MNGKHIITRAAACMMVAALLFLLFSPIVRADPPRHDSDGVLLRINGDATLASGETTGAVVVVNGNATIQGRAATVVVVEGTVVVDAARVGDLVVVNGHADLRNGSVVTGNVDLVESTMDRSPDVVISGGIEYDPVARMGKGIVLLGLAFGLGYMLAMLLAGGLMAVLAGGILRRAGRSLTGEVGRTLLATLVLWIVVPAIAVAAIVTVVGIPTGIGILLFALPALGFLGFVVTGLRIGDWVLHSVRSNPEPARPFWGAVVGIALLLIAGWVPVIGAIVTPLASLLGSGSLALTLWRRVRRTEPIESAAGRLEVPPSMTVGGASA